MSTTSRSSSHITNVRASIVSQDGWDAPHLEGWTPHDSKGGGGRFALSLDADRNSFDSLRDLIKAPCPSASDELSVESGQIKWLDGTTQEVTSLSVGWHDDGLEFTATFGATIPSTPKHDVFTLSRAEATILLGALDAWSGGVRPFTVAGIGAAAGLQPREMRDSSASEANTLRMMAALRGNALVWPQPDDDALVLH